jgi:hypothetical protein
VTAPQRDRTPVTGASNAAGHPVPPGPGAGDRAAPGPLAVVFLTNATMTSAGPGPGVKRLPAAEAAGLVARKLAIYGETPPTGWPG